MQVAVGHETGLGDVRLVEFGQPVDRFRGQSEVLGQVDDPHVGGYLVLFHEPFALAMTEAEEDDIDPFKGHVGRKRQVGLAIQVLMDVTHPVARIALAVGKDDFRLGMVEQQSGQFAARIAGRT